MEKQIFEDPINSSDPQTNMKIQLKSFWPGLIALTGATILFCLPGNEFPESDLFDLLQADKWIHVGLFGVLVILWCLPLEHRINDPIRLKNFFIGIAIGFILYGIAIEFIQGNFIPKRTLGIDDMIADGIGCGVGFLIVKRTSGNRKPPG